MVVEIGAFASVDRIECIKKGSPCDNWIKDRNTSYLSSLWQQFSVSLSIDIERERVATRRKQMKGLP